MACLPLPAVPAPPDIFPITLGPPALPPISGDANLCCHIFAFSIPLVIPLPPGSINPGITATLNAALKSVQSVIDALGLECARE